MRLEDMQELARRTGKTIEVRKRRGICVFCLTRSAFWFTGAPERPGRTR